jgi:hypothetical protein
MTTRSGRSDPWDELYAADPGAGFAEVDPSYERLAAGALTAQEVEALRVHSETSAMALATFEAMQPLGDAFEQQVADGIPAQERPAVGPSVRSEAPRRSARRWWLGLAASPAFVAIVIGLTSGPRVPDYSAEWRSGVATERGVGPADGFARILAFGSPIDLVLLPAQGTDAALRIEVYLDRVSTETLLDVEPIRSETGAFRLRGRVGEPPFALAPGPHRLLVAVGPRYSWWVGLTPGGRGRTFELPIVVEAP